MKTYPKEGGAPFGVANFMVELANSLENRNRSGAEALEMTLPVWCENEAEQVAARVLIFAVANALHVLDHKGEEAPDQGILF